MGPASGAVGSRCRRAPRVLDPIEAAILENGATDGTITRTRHRGRGARGDARAPSCSGPRRRRRGAARPGGDPRERRSEARKSDGETP